MRRNLKEAEGKTRPDEQEADRGGAVGVSRPIDAKPHSCTERCDVDPTGISEKVSAQYL